MKTLSLAPLTRVEGHGRVELTLEDGRLADVRLALLESPRLFEGLVVGRSFAEVPALVCRICALCTAVHRVAAAAALERALGLEIPPAARLVRELLLLGGHIESHALHLFCLVLPDIRGRQSVLELLQAGDAVAREGLALKGVGNRIQELAGGRVIHPVNVEVGGVLQLPDRRGLEELLATLEDWQQRIQPLVEPFNDPGNYPSSTPAVGTRIAVAGESPLSLQGESLHLGDGRRVPGDHYTSLLEERPVPHSHAKQAWHPGGTFLAGALARLELTAGGVPGPVKAAGIFANNAAQALELAWALARSRELAEQLLAADRDAPLRVPVVPRAGVGTAVVEAPRGLLVHHYLLDDLGRVVAADIITPTAINQATIEEQLRLDLAELADEAGMKDLAAQVVRAFDPCISCAVHVLKKR
jgi:sulfhydrogenase subunit alpha